MPRDECAAKDVPRAGGVHRPAGVRRDAVALRRVGNGLSDRCPCESADLVLATGELLDHCRANNIGAVDFRNFRDVEREVLKRLVLEAGSGRST